MLCMSGYVGLTPQRGICTHGLLCLLRPSFGCTICGANQVVFLCGLKPASRCVVSGFSWLWLSCRPISALPVSRPRLPDRIYKAICGWMLSVLDLEAYGGGFAVNEGWLPQVSGLRQCNKRPRAPLGLLSPAGCRKSQLLKGPR